MFETKRYMNTPNGKAMLKFAIDNTKAVVIGAGAGLSTSVGYVYNGERFDKYFGDFGAKYGYDNMYAGGFCAYKKPEIKWAFWSRYIWINRYMKMPKPVYEDLFDLVKDKEYFVLTTNVDHCFQRAGFDKERIFYTQGDYGLWQCSKPCHKATYDNGRSCAKWCSPRDSRSPRTESLSCRLRRMDLRISASLRWKCLQSSCPFALSAADPWR